MADDYFPVSLPGLLFAGRTTFYGDDVQEGYSGAEFRINRYAGPRYRYSFDAEFLRSSLAEIAEMHGFFEGHGGRRDSFLLVDPVDGVTRRVRFDEPELELVPFARGMTSILAGSVDLVTVVG